MKQQSVSKRLIQREQWPNVNHKKVLLFTGADFELFDRTSCRSFVGDVVLLPCVCLPIIASCILKQTTHLTKSVITFH